MNEKKRPAPDQPVVTVAPESPAQYEKALGLANRLGLELVEVEAMETGFFLLVGATMLTLQQAGPGALGPISVDFTSGVLDYRRRHGGGRRQPLGRAIGLKPGYNPLVIDATAGLGRDSFILACLGCRVQLIERSAIIAVLLEDGVQRAAAHPEIGPLIRDNLHIISGDSIELLPGLAYLQPDVVYLDPMYPVRSKSALVKKEMRLLRELVGPDPDSAALLDAALKTARNRVVVKRPSQAPFLGGQKPATAIKSEKNRFDLYFPFRSLPPVPGP